MITGRKLLLADDSLTIQKVVSLTFTDEGLNVTTVSDGEKAIEKLEENPPDIVLADVYMPGLSGYEVCERIKSDGRFRHIPVLLLVGTFEPFDEAEARRVGADDVLTKPFQSIRELVSKVGSLLSGRSSEKSIGGLMQDLPEREDAAKDLPRPAQVAAPSPSEESSAKTDEQTGTPAVQFPWEAPGGTASSGAPRDKVAVETQAARDDFSDFGIDDQLIEATPAESFGTAHQSHGAAIAHPSASADMEETPTLVVSAPVEKTDTRHKESPKETVVARDEDELSDLTLESPRVVASKEVVAPEEEAREDLPTAEPAYATHMASAAAADNALLELSNIQPSSVAADEADDFILDLAYEKPVSQRYYAVAAGTRGSYAEAEESPLDLGFGIEPKPPLAKIEQPAQAPAVAEEASPASVKPTPVYVEPTPVHEVEEPVVPQAEDVKRPASVEEGREAVTPQAALAGGQQITLEQLSPEVIDAVARRVVVQLSEKVVQEIAWEVVPDLAERLIKRHLEERSRAQ